MKTYHGVKTMHIKVTLISDLCAASGFGLAGAVDTDINFDENTGLPYVPSKRIKGCLREAGLDILSICPEYEESFYSLFGKKGQSESGILKIYDGKLDYNSGNHNRDDVLDALTAVRTNIRMEEAEGDGLIRKTQDDMLRVVRVLIKGETLYFKVDCLEHVDFLAKCCLMLRNIGSNRTRGLGEVECKLLVDEEYPIKGIEWDEPQFITYPFSGDYKIAYYQISLDEPVISSPITGSGGGGACESYLPGSMLLGCFAGLWIKSRIDISHEQNEDYAQNERNEHNEHNNPEFRRLFLEGGVKFDNAYPCSLLKKMLYPAPDCYKTDKTRDIAHDISVSDNFNAGSKIGGYVILSDSQAAPTPRTINVRREVAQHHARPYDRATGHAKEGGNAKDGALYSYMAISAGQTFIGSIIGSEDDLNLLNEMSETKMRLGRSRSAQYGEVTFNWISINYPKNWALDSSVDGTPGGTLVETPDGVSDKANDGMPDGALDDALVVPPDGTVRVHVRSPLILYDKKGTIKPDIALLGERLGLEIVRTFATATLTSGYNSKWRLPLQQMGAIQAGSVIIMKNASENKIPLAAEQHIGLRTGEGCGHISIEAMLVSGKLNKPVSENEYKPFEIMAAGEASGKHNINLSKRINLTKEKRKYEELATRDSQSKVKSAPTNAQLSRLLNAINRRNDPVNSLDRLRDELRDGEDSIWKIEDKRKKMQAFTLINEPPSENWDLYKAWLTTLIYKVKLERRKGNV